MSDVRSDSTLVPSNLNVPSIPIPAFLPLADQFHASSSFGDPNAQPPTPQQTPTTTSFASPVFETPRQPHGSFTDLGGSTPRFAEEYSVFNSTPGNLRGSHAQFPDFVPPTPASSHKRLLSAEDFALEIATHANHFSPNPNLPPVDPSKRLASSPSLNNTGNFARESTPASSPSLKTARSAKKLRRGTITKDPEALISPPPTAHKGEQKLVTKLNMQYERSFHQPDFTEGSQPHDITALMANSSDLFSYPLSAPAGASTNFWDPQASMGMDIDFSAATQGMFPTSSAGHRQTGSFDWNNDIQLFQDSNMVPSSSNQENVQPQQDGSIAMSQFQQLGDPFTVMNPAEMVDPSLMMGQTGAMTGLGMEQSMPAPVVSKGKSIARPDIRRTGSKKPSRANKGPDRTLASSPFKHPRAGLDQVAGEPSGPASLSRSNTLPTLAPAARSMAQFAGGSSDTSRPMARPSGRISPVKSQRRLSSLAAIRESSPARQRASVRFCIDSRGYASATTTIMGEDGVSQRLPRSQSSRDLSSCSTWDVSSESESEDEDPIVIPSRTNSFSASFALPDPRKPVGSIFHRPRRSTSDRSNSSAGGEHAQRNGDESETETVHNERRGRGGDAASELAKLVKSRQKRLSQPNMPERLLTNFGNSRSDTVSPSSLAESGYGTDSQGVRCVCKRSGASKNTFMVQW